MPAQQVYQKPQQAPENPNVFSLRTHKFNARGRLVSRNLYRLHIKDGTKYFERPVNSGNLFYENNEAAGRVEFVQDEKTKRMVKKFDFAAEHKEYRAPLVGAEKLEAELAETKAQNATLASELEAIRKEREEMQKILAEIKAAKVTAPPPQASAPQAQKIDMAKAAGPGSENL